MISLKVRESRSVLSEMLNWKEEQGRGRCCMLASAAISRIIADLITGSLYTAFLTAATFSVVEIGMFATLRFLSSCFSFFAPVFLERYQKRKWILAALRFAYYLLCLPVLTWIPGAIADRRLMLFMFGAVIFLSGIINNLFLSGYAVWHIRFLPDCIRARYFSSEQILSVFISCFALLPLSALADRLGTATDRMHILAAIRIIGFLIGILDIALLILPQEYPYPRRAAVCFKNIMRIPLKCRSFLLTVLLVAIWDFSNELSRSAWSYHLLNTVGAGITLLNAASVLYAAALILLSPFWRKILKRLSWFRTFSVAALIHIPSYLLCIFVNSRNFHWLYTLVMVIQSVDGVALNLTFMDFKYINTPPEDQTYFISFLLWPKALRHFLGRLPARCF